jgi:hypothetical protein
MQAVIMIYGETDAARFVPNLTPDGALVLIATAAKRSTTSIRQFLHRYLAREHIFTTSLVSIPMVSSTI